MAQPEAERQLEAAIELAEQGAVDSALLLLNHQAAQCGTAPDLTAGHCRDVLKARALLYLDYGKYHKARFDLLRLLEHDPRNIRILEPTALAHYETGEYQTAVELYTRAIDLRPEVMGLYAMRAESYLRLRDYAAAESDLKKVLIFDPGDVLGLQAMGDLHYQQHLYNDAAGWYRQVLEIEARHPTALLKLAHTLRQQNSHKEAIALYDGLLHQLEGDERNEVRCYRAASQLALGDSTAALTAVAEVLADPSSALHDRAHLIVGRHLIATRRYAAAIDELERGSQLQPRRANLHTWLGIGYIALHSYREARAHLDHALALDERSADAYAALALWHLRNGEPLAANRVALRALQIEPNHQSARARSGRAALELGNLTAGRELLTDALAVAPLHRETRLYLAEANMLLRHYDIAIKQVNQLRDEDPTDPVAYLLRARLHHEIFETEFALEYLQTAMPAMTHDPAAYHLLGNIQLSIAQYEQAEVSFRKAVEIHPSAVYRNSVAEVLLARGQYAVARDTLTAILGQHPDHHRSYYLRGQCYARLGRSTKALQDYQRAIGHMPNEARYYYARALLLREMGNYAKAIADLHQAVRLHDDYPEAYIALGSLQALEHNSAAANEALTTAFDILTDQKRIAPPELYLEFGLLAIQREDYPSALEYYDAGLQVAPEHVALREARAAVHQQLGNPSAAMDDLNKLAEAQPTDPEVLLASARQQLALGNATDARAMLDKAIARQPDAPAAYYLARASATTALGDYESTAHDLSRAEAALRSTRDPAQSQWLDLYRQQAQLYLQQPDKSDALEPLDSWLQLVPDDAEALTLRGRLRFELSDYPGAIADYEATDARGRSAETTLLLAQAYFYTQQYDHSLAMLSTAIQAGGNNATAYYLRGSVHAMRDQHEQAIKDYTAAIAIEAKPDMYYDRAISYRAVGRVAAACSDFRQARMMGLQVVDPDLETLCE